MSTFEKGELRQLLDAAFEPYGDGFVYYKNRWAPGIPVSAGEREAYLTNWTWASGAAFRRKIKGRAPATSPRGNEAMFRIIDAMPARFVWAWLVGAALLVSNGLGTENLLLRVGEFGLAIACVVFTAVIVARRHRFRRP